MGERKGRDESGTDDGRWIGQSSEFSIESGWSGNEQLDCEIDGILDGAFFEDSHLPADEYSASGQV